MSTKNQGSRLEPGDRKRQILDAALALAEGKPYTHLTREAIAGRAGIAPGLVNRYFSTMVKLRRAIIREAVERGIASIVADGLAVRDPQAQKARPEVLASARQLLATR